MKPSRISKPDLGEALKHTSIQRKIDQWFDAYVEPINKALREGVVVYFGYDNNGDIDWSTPDTHTATLINIQPIEQDSAEKVLTDFIKHANSMQFTADEVIALEKRAKKVLNVK